MRAFTQRQNRQGGCRPTAPTCLMAETQPLVVLLQRNHHDPWSSTIIMLVNRYTRTDQEDLAVSLLLRVDLHFRDVIRPIT